jgi:thiamine pyrophosphokinase
MNALIVGAAPAADPGAFYASLIAAAEIVIAADAAGEWCTGLGRVPDATVGDFDSALQGAADRLASAGSSVTTLPVAKDESDLDACVLEARSRGARALTFTAAFSLRLDHTLAAFGSVLGAVDMQVSIEEPDWWAVASPADGGPVLLDLPAGTLFTVLAPAGADGVTIDGACFGLDGVRLDPLSSRGLSNVSTGECVKICAGEGRLLVMVQRGVQGA